MPIQQLSLFVENRPGSLSAVCKVLKENNLSIRTLSLADTQQFGILRLLLKEHEQAKAALEKAGFIVKYMYAFTFGMDDKAVIVFRFENPAHAVEELKDEPIKLVKASELFR